MILRKWQNECIGSAIWTYTTLKKHFLALATPGAGKSLMASALAKQLYDQKLIEIVLCFSPSSIVSNDFRYTLEKQFGEIFNGSIGALGNTFTYQSLNTLSNDTWQLFEKYSVFVIFDEIHHCAGSCDLNSNAWGNPIIKRMKDKAAYTISLTGTPWRSDALPIALSDYCNSSKEIKCDYTYGLKDAIKNNVCRIPQIIAIDNDNVTISKNDECTHYSSFLDLLACNIVPYVDLVENELIIEQILLRAIKKLDQLREVNDDAAGLIVASSIVHAQLIQQIFEQKFNQHTTLVTSDEEQPRRIIDQFRKGTEAWIISVGMICEGTNIPRLQICCHLSNIKTELHFRQVLGRILRVTDSLNQEAILFIPAETNLIKYAYRISQDIPDGISKVEILNMDVPFEADISDISDISETSTIDDIELELEAFDPLLEGENESSKSELKHEQNSQYKVQVMNIIGEFSHTPLKLDDFETYKLSSQSIEKLEELNTLIL